MVVVEMAARARRPRCRSGGSAASRVDVASYLGSLIEVAPVARLQTSLFELARATGCDVATVRVAVAALDPADHVVSVDVITTSPATRFWIEWAPVTAVVDLLLDWDLLTVDISMAELSQWLGVSTEVTRRTVRWLAATAGVSVRRRSLGGAAVRIAIAADQCPLTAEVSAAVG
jgi:hypothetical protein